MDELERLQKIAEESYEKISQSATFVDICSDNYVESPACLIQLSLGILLDKPLFLLIQKGVRPSKNLIRILDGFEFYEANDEQSFQQASEKLMEKVKERIKEL